MPRGLGRFGPCQQGCGVLRRLVASRCRIGQQSDDSWYLEFNRPPTPGPAAELLAEVRRWLAEERITQTIVWIGEQPFAVSG